MIFSACCLYVFCTNAKLVVVSFHVESFHKSYWIVTAVGNESSPVLMMLLPVLQGTQELHAHQQIERRNSLTNMGCLHFLIRFLTELIKLMGIQSNFRFSHQHLFSNVFRVYSSVPYHHSWTDPDHYGENQAESMSLDADVPKFATLLNVIGVLYGTKPDVKTSLCSGWCNQFILDKW